MQQTLLVHGREGLGKSRPERRREQGGERSVARHVSAQVEPLDVLGGQPRSVRFGIGVQERGDPGAPDGLEDLHFLCEALPGLGIYDGRLDHLDCGGLAARGLSQVHLPHPALPDTTEQLVAAQLGGVVWAERCDVHELPFHSGGVSSGQTVVSE